MHFDFDWVDAFSDRAFGGNGCAVVHDAVSVDADVATAFVRETSLVECTFAGPSDVADVRVRYFLASREIPFAGHPTIATVVAMRHRGLIGDGSLRLETGAGIVPVTVKGGRVTMIQVAPQFGSEVSPEVVAALGGIAPGDIIAPPQIVSTGLPFCITLLRDRSVLERLVLDQRSFPAYAEATGASGTDVMEPFWVTLSGATAAGDTYSRLLLAPPSPAEDPFTGSATGAMAAYLWARGLIDRPNLTAEQGHGLGRPGQARVRVLGPPDGITGVEVAGDGFVLMSGRVDLPAGGAG